MPGKVADLLAVESDAAGRRTVETADQLEERALAGPVGTDYGDDLAVVDPERHARDCREAAEAFRDRVNLEADIIAKHVEKLLQSGVHTRKQD